MSATDATNGHGYIVTGMDKAGDRSVVVHLLLPSGRRRSVLVDVWNVAEPVLRSAAEAFEEERRRYPSGVPRPRDNGNTG